MLQSLEAMTGQLKLLFSVEWIDEFTMKWVAQD